MSDTSIDEVIERVSRTYGSWSRTTTVEQMREDWDRLFWSDAIKASTADVSANGVQAQWIAAPGADPAKVLIYFHGGGFSVGSIKSHYDLIARVSLAGGVRALGVDYRRAPEHPFPAAFDDALAAYRWVLSQGVEPRNIALAGDSAGGGLALSLTIFLRDAGEPLPSAVVAMSPWTDLEASGESYQTRAQSDPIHQRAMVLAMARRYLGKSGDARDPRVSPLHAGLHGLPPMLLQVGDRETVLDDARMFADKGRGAGVEVQLEVWDGMIHVFQQFAAQLPEARRAIESIGAFLRARIGRGADYAEEARS